MLTLVRDMLAAARLLRLLRDDSIFQSTRETLISMSYAARGDKKPEQYTWQEWALLDRKPPKLAQLMECPWCLGVWCAFAVIVLRSRKYGTLLCDMLAVSYVASLAEIHVVQPPNPKDN